MTLRRSRAASRIRWIVSFALFWGGILVGCVRDATVNIDRNRAPDTFVTEGPPVSANPRDPTDIFYRAHLYWRGEDVDGTVDGFRFAVDDTSDPSAWTYTTRTDSTFRFQAGEVGAKEHLFLIRAVDNLGKQDPSPDTLRFEAFTTAAPVVHYVNDQIEVFGGGNSPAPPQFGLSPGDTVLVNSSIRFVWTGSDADGEVVRWESAFGSENPVQHARDDTTRLVTGLTSGPHQFLVNAFDDAGAISATGGLFELTCNFDPKTTINSVVSTLPRPWLGPDSTLIITHDLSHPDHPDTIPYCATLKFAWTSEDPDGPVVRYYWRVAFIQGSTENTIVDTANEPWFDPVHNMVVTDPRPLNTTSLIVPLQLQVAGEDVYGNVETKPTPVPLYANFPPVVTAQQVGIVNAGVPVHFPFSGYDRDGHPDSLRYRWQFDNNLPSPLTSFPPGALKIDAFFQASEAGNHQLKIWAQDNGGAASESEPALVAFTVVVPGPPEARPGAGRRNVRPGGGP
jgi:hypothetical protein